MHDTRAGVRPHDSNRGKPESGSPSPYVSDGETKPRVDRAVDLERGRLLADRDQLKRRIDEAAKFAPLEQLGLSPQCGFASTEEGNLLAEDEQWAKLSRCVEVAREVWG